MLLLACAKPAPNAPVESAAGGAKAWEFERSETYPDPHGGAVNTDTRFVLLPTPSGLFILELARPSGAEGSPAFAELLRTFRAAP